MSRRERVNSHLDHGGAFTDSVGFESECDEHDIGRPRASRSLGLAGIREPKVRFELPRRDATPIPLNPITTKQPGRLNRLRRPGLAEGGDVAASLVVRGVLIYLQVVLGTHKHSLGESTTWSTLSSALNTLISWGPWAAWCLTYLH